MEEQREREGNKQAHGEAAAATANGWRLQTDVERPRVEHDASVLRKGIDLVVRGTVGTDLSPARRQAADVSVAAVETRRVEWAGGGDGLSG